MVFSREFPTSIDAALKLAEKLLRQSAWIVSRGDASIRAEAELIVICAANLGSRIELYTRAQDRIPDEAGEKVIVWAMARAEGRILQHLTGRQQFLDHLYEVSPAVLVPRPETEVLVVTAIERLLARHPTGPKLGIEIGLGSGCISIELLNRFPELVVFASELSSEAVGVARRNAEQILGGTGKKPPLERLRILKPKSPEEVLEPFLARPELHHAADFLISNPPYLVSGDVIDPDVAREEPRAALYAPDSDALHFYRAMAKGATQLLRPGGQVILETPSFRAVAIEELFRENGWATTRYRDMAGEERVVTAEK